MKFILSIPWEVRITALFILGAAVGSFVNFFVDRMRWETPRHSPWNSVWERLLRRWFGIGDVRAASHTSTQALPTERKKKKPPRRSAKRENRPAVSPWLDLVPVIGWFSLSRFSPQKGKKFWVRPLLVELICVPSAGTILSTPAR